jgi:uncharacterized protein DUF4166
VRAGAVRAGKDSEALYIRVMGDAWARVAEPVRCMHTHGATVRAHGRLRVEHGRHPLARALAWVLRLPRPGAATETRLLVTHRADGDHWLRTFSGRHLETRQYHSSGSELAERFGVLEFRFRLEPSEDGGIRYVQRSVEFLLGPVRVPVPASWGPRVEAREAPAGPRRVVVAVRVALPAVGPLITYDGCMTIEDTSA